MAQALPVIIAMCSCLSRLRHLLLLAAAIAAVSCSSRDTVLDEREKALTSLRATVAAIGHAWLSGAVSSTYTRTALESTQELVSKERTKLTASPDVLADPRGGRISESEEELARTLALLWKGVDARDVDAARKQIAVIDSRMER